MDAELEEQNVGATMRIKVIISVCIFGAVFGYVAASMVPTPDRVESRGVMICAFGVDGQEQHQTITFVPGWEPPESWRCAVALSPREWHPEDQNWVDAIGLDLGRACGWIVPASGCCPECLVEENGCPEAPGGCHE